MKMFILNVWFFVVFILSFGIVYDPQGPDAVILICIINVLFGFELQTSKTKVNKMSRRKIALSLLIVMITVSFLFVLSVFLEHAFNADIGMRLVGCLYLTMAVYIYIKGFIALRT
ncbi:hypothetical protein ABT56_12370 [Photobacterium aquae]|uniref:Uncharacterized protein n=1 Tax=Photobacterium aquae TaxID=1195763 RepID=A0A0J1H035_9GAMM|nr:hypothetical protein [Photobacterium aquae]KLV05174.1 hypothetical protein ABT56_12370 [Photobacterium aquae]